MAKLYAAQTIKNNINLLGTYKKSINSVSDATKTKNRIINDISLCIKMSEELTQILKESRYIEITRAEAQLFLIFLREQLNAVKALNQTNILEAKNIIDNLTNYTLNGKLITERLEDISDYEAISEINYLNNNVYDEDIEEISITDAHMIMNHINTNRPYSVFSPKCGRGTGLILLAAHGEGITYGLEIRDTAYETAKQNLNRTIKGEMSGSKISNDCFDIMHVCPKISWYAEKGATGNLIEKREKAALRNTIKYLRKEGILIFTIPKTRLTKDMAFIFSKLLRDVEILEHSRNNKYIHIIGVKDIVKEARQEVYAHLTYLDNYTKEIYTQYDLPSGGIKEPELFRGSMLDPAELENLVNNSGLMDSFWEKQSIEANDTEMRPLLPFNMGQIGLVLTSGCLDGVVEEYEGQYHAIKGMVTKVRNTNDTIDNDSETSIETISNKVQINLLTPDGKFIELA